MNVKLNKPYNILRVLDEGIEEAVNSIMWAAPRIATDISEFKVRLLLSPASRPRFPFSLE